MNILNSIRELSICGIIWNFSQVNHSVSMCRALFWNVLGLHRWIWFWTVTIPSLGPNLTDQSRHSIPYSWLHQGLSDDTYAELLHNRRNEEAAEKKTFIISLVIIMMNVKKENHSHWANHLWAEAVLVCNGYDVAVHHSWPFSRNPLRP